MESLSNIYMLSLLGGIISCLVTYIEAKINKENRSRKVYLKIFILSSIVSLLLLFLAQNIPKNKLEINQDILTGNPGF